MDKNPELLLSSMLDPSRFDVTVGAFLIGLDAEKYIDIFRKRNIGQSTLVELTNEDLILLGVDDVKIRNAFIQEVKNLPIYEELSEELQKCPLLGPLEIVKTLEESSTHLYRIYLSMLANSLTIKRAKAVPDCLLHKDKYASDIALSTLTEINAILKSMEIALCRNFESNEDLKHSTKKKIVVGTVGAAAIGILAVFFIRSLKQL